ncbi:MAG: hypothetical protein ABIN89_22595 [Chitinophagaceae bacterium]
MNLKNFLFRLSHWETWHYHAKYIPLSPAWLWYCLRSGSFWFFTPSNPTLTFGGFEGESKKEMYDQLPPGSYPKSIYISHTASFEEVERQLNTGHYNYPFAVKPDVGMMGFLFRQISNLEEFRLYHQIMPTDYIIQELIHYPIEVSVFYYRFPNEQKGTITGFLKKEFLQVTGDGESTLWKLIQAYPRVRFRLPEMKSKHEHRLNDIIPKDEVYCLSYALNLSRGGKMVSLAHEKDDKLAKVFDDLSQYSKHFYYGRYDIKCASIEDLKEGKNYSILEFNGSGAEPHHVYGNGNTLFQAYKIILQHWNILYKISRYNNMRGIKYWGFLKGFRFLKEAKKHFKMLKQLDTQTAL